jgi:hypothetical protein
MVLLSIIIVLSSCSSQEEPDETVISELENMPEEELKTIALSEKSEKTSIAGQAYYSKDLSKTAGKVLIKKQEQTIAQLKEQNSQLTKRLEGTNKIIDPIFSTGSEGKSIIDPIFNEK